MAPSICDLHDQGLIEAVALHQNATFDAAIQFARTEGFLAAPETAHAIRASIVEALKAKEEGQEKVIAFNFSGHGHFDLEAYDRYLAGQLEDFTLPQEEIEAALAHLPPYQEPVME
jgi:tryptophan synthase beta chain